MAIKDFSPLISKVKELPSKRIALAGADNEHALEAVVHAWKEELAEVTLVGDTRLIRATADRLGLDLSPFEILESPGDAAATTAAVLVGSGKADVLMKGGVSSKVFLRAVLNEANGLRTERLLSHVMLAEVPTYHKLVFITDAGLNIAPTLAEKADMLRNAVGVAHALGVEEPKVAVLAAVEEVNLPAMPVTGEAAALTAMCRRGQLGRCLVDGPLAFDNAVSAESARIKNITGPVAGDADILFCPDIEAANILYKCITYFAAGHIGAIIVGARAPVVMPSRADDAESKYLSLVTAMAVTLKD